jgi:hypothetical protein
MAAIRLFASRLFGPALYDAQGLNGNEAGGTSGAGLISGTSTVLGIGAAIAEAVGQIFGTSSTNGVSFIEGSPSLTDRIQQIMSGLSGAGGGGGSRFTSEEWKEMKEEVKKEIDGIKRKYEIEDETQVFGKKEDQDIKDIGEMLGMYQQFKGRK